MYWQGVHGYFGGFAHQFFEAKELVGVKICV